MSERYYELALLQTGFSAKVTAQELAVDLDAVTADNLVCNDVDLNRRRSDDDIVFVSGGGSLLLGGRHLLVVRRQADARVHPGKFSLFTGRSDSLEERENPHLLVRELFEELLLFQEGRLIWPRNAEFQPLVDKTYAALGHDHATATQLAFHALPLPTRPMSVASRGAVHRFNLTWHLSSRGDLNVLQIFATDLRLEGLTARDGEGLGRSIWAYDIGSATVAQLGADTKGHALARTDMTEHLAFVADNLAASHARIAATARTT